jgi:hypothetical protein
MNLGSRRVWPGRTRVAMLPRGDIGGSYRGFRSSSRVDRCEMQFYYTQDLLCIVKSHVLREVTLLRRTQRI